MNGQKARDRDGGSKVRTKREQEQRRMHRSLACNPIQRPCANARVANKRERRRDSKHCSESSWFVLKDIEWLACYRRHTPNEVALAASSGKRTTLKRNITDVRLGRDPQTSWNHRLWCLPQHLSVSSTSHALAGFRKRVWRKFYAALFFPLLAFSPNDTMRFILFGRKPSLPIDDPSLHYLLFDYNLPRGEEGSWVWRTKKKNRRKRARG